MSLTSPNVVMGEDSETDSECEDQSGNQIVIETVNKLEQEKPYTRHFTQQFC
jgi:hypothetical protein